MGLPIRQVILFTIVTLVTINLQVCIASASIGVDYGMLGDNLPTPSNVINLYMQENIPLMRLFNPNYDVLDALRGTGIRVALGVTNNDVTNIGKDFDLATQWVATNVVPYQDVNIEWIALGNEMVPGAGSEFILDATMNIKQALDSAVFPEIKVSTVISSAVLGASYPHSAGEFSSESAKYLNGIVGWLSITNNPLLINVYPYWAYALRQGDIPLAHALFNPDQPVIDGDLEYYSLFEAMVDAFYVALEKIGGASVRIVVSETGWPTAGNEPATSVENVQSYNQRLVEKMKQNGTPRRSSSVLDIFIFAMFNENQKDAGVEQNWGIYYPNMEPVYSLTL